MDEQIKQKVESFFTQFKKQSYKKGEILIRADDDPTAVFYLVDGMVKEYAISQKGEEIVVNIFKSSAFFPMSYAINKSVNTFYFEATTPVIAWKTPAEEAVKFIKDNPDVMYNLLSRLYIGTDGLLMKLVYLMSGSANARLITEMILSARRFGIKDDQSGNITLNISETELAARTGLTRETVSREIKKLKDKDILRVKQKNISIPDISRLEGELGEN